MVRNQQRELAAAALVVLMVTALLPERAHAWTLKWSTVNYYLFHPNELLKLYYAFAIPLIRPFVSKVIEFLTRLFGFINHPIRTLAMLNKWKQAVVQALRSRIIDRNPYVRCVKIGWPKCWKGMRGLNWFSSVFCPMVIYWECEYAWKYGRRGATEPTPYWEDHTNGWGSPARDPSWGPRRPLPPALPIQTPVGKGRCRGHCPSPPRPRLQQ